MHVLAKILLNLVHNSVNPPFSAKKLEMPLWMRAYASISVFSFMIVGLNTGACNPANAARLYQDVTYGGTGGAARTLDASIIDGSPRPLVIFIHGGGWRKGDKRVGNKIAKTFLERGFNFAAINYSISDTSRVEDECRDVAEAMSYLVNRPAFASGSVTSFVLVGFSAGGHLAALVSANPLFLRRVSLPSNIVSTVVLLDAPALGDGWTTRKAGVKRLEPIFGSDPTGWKQFNPSVQVASAATLPKYCIFFDDQRQWAAEAAAAFQSALSKRDARFSVVKSSGRSHMAFLQDLADTRSSLSSEIISCINKPY